MVKNILLKVAYDGSNFHGYQYQENLRTVEESLKSAINKVTGENNRIIASGRTDSGVHAYSQYVNFLTASPIKASAFNYHLDPLLPDDIIALSAREVDLGFHARFSAIDKTYKYIVYRGKVMHPIHRKYMEQITYPLDLDRLQKGLDLLKGDHDFRAFMREDKNLEINTFRKIDDCYYIEDGDRLEIYFRANSFLHNQVRIMVGSLIELARGRLSINDYKMFFDKDNQKKANPALSPAGLYLWSVNYD